ncbi:hypothetical protein FACS189418_8210 [Clostridia bacterium]|nr:hypothetical protein FACS189418_8210 [Clostridia bacterium]
MISYFLRLDCNVDSIAIDVISRMNRVMETNSLFRGLFHFEKISRVLMYTIREIMSLDSRLTV